MKAWSLMGALKDFQTCKEKAGKDFKVAVIAKESCTRLLFKTWFNQT